MSQQIAIVDDEPDILELVAINLEKAGYVTGKYISGKDFVLSLQNYTPDLIILDLMLPDIDGLDICRKLKGMEKTQNTPIIMLTAKGDEIDKILGLEMGADDYVTKPFSPRELVARVKAILRRNQQKSESKSDNLGKLLSINYSTFEVLVDGVKIDLTSTEFKILKILAHKKGWVFSRDQLLDQLWGNDKIVIDRTIDVHIKNIRDKLGPAKDIIKNVRGVGYKIDE